MKYEIAFCPCFTTQSSKLGSFLLQDLVYDAETDVKLQYLLLNKMNTLSSYKTENATSLQLN